MQPEPQARWEEHETGRFPGSRGESHAARKCEGALSTPQLSPEKCLQIKFLKVTPVLLRSLSTQGNNTKTGPQG